MKVEIPFNGWSWERMQSGRKICTSRNKRYGEIGDWFFVGSDRYVIIGHVRILLGDVAKYWWRQEGAKDEAEFRWVWCDIHKRAGWTPEKKVWLHIFRKVGIQEES